VAVAVILFIVLMSVFAFVFKGLFVFLCECTARVGEESARLPLDNGNASVAVMRWWRAMDETRIADVIRNRLSLSFICSSVCLLGHWFIRKCVY
jgi:hypothetical protein